MLQVIRKEMLNQGINEMLALNEQSRQNGLVLTRREVTELILNRERVLKDTGRVELSFEPLKYLIEAFSTSDFLTEETYAATLNDLVEIFYTLKNDTDDRIPDSALISVMKHAFEKECEGSIELLSGRVWDCMRRQRQNQSLNHDEEEY